MPNIARLQHLLNHVSNLPPERIDMNVWADGPDANLCGTAACLGGHATTLFHKEIELRENPNIRGSQRFYIQHLIDDEAKDSSALEIVFDLDNDELFACDRSPEQAIEDLKQFIEDNS